jgi:hypothetical protein
LLGWLASVVLVLLGRVLVGTWPCACRSAALGQLCLGPAAPLDFRPARPVVGIRGGLALPAGHQVQETFLVFALAGICVSSMMAYAFDLRAALLFSVPILAALVVRLFWQGDPVSTSTALVVLLFMVYLAIVAWRASRAVRVNVALRGAEVQRLEALRRGHERLGRAERLAKLGSFDWNPLTGELQWSDEHFRLWGLAPESVAHRCIVSAGGAPG